MIKVKLFLQYRLVTLKLNLCMSHVEGLLSDSADKISKFHFFSLGSLSTPQEAGLLFIVLERGNYSFTG